ADEHRHDGRLRQLLYEARDREHDRVGRQSSRGRDLSAQRLRHGRTACQRDNDYVLHFAADEIPPVGAFWSLTMYDEKGFQAANPIDRFAIGDRNDLRYNDDGSLDIYIQHDTPGAERESNWLPAPRGPLGLTMRLYAPAPKALDGRWNPPPIRRLT